MPIPEYIDYAEYYDFDHNIDFDLEFYLDYARQGGSPILELACGTGRLLIPIAEAGFEVHGIDLSENMLALCRRKVVEKGLEERTHLYHADMTVFELPRQDFNLVFIAARSFMHVYTQADQISCLERVYTHLLPGGTFIVDIYAPDFELLAQDPEGPFIVRREFDLPDGHHVIRSDRFVRNDKIDQVQHTEIRYEEYDANGTPVRQRTLPLTTRYTFRFELQLLLERAGFEVVDVFRDYDRYPYDGTGEILTIARRPG